MKLLKTILVLITWIGFSGCASTKYINTHVDLAIDDPCVFERYNLDEKLSMTREVGEKTLRNLDSCRIRYQANYDIIQAHNKAHKGSDG